MWFSAWLRPMRIWPAEAMAQSSRVRFTISMMVRTPAPFGADALGIGAVEFDLGGGVRLVAELVLQALEADRVLAAVGPVARHQIAGEPARRLRQHQEGIAHRRRHEPFVAGDLDMIAVPAPRWVMLARTSVPPWRSVMPMPRVTPFFSHHGSGRRIVGARQDLGQPLGEQRRLGRSAPMQAWVMVIGQMWPLSAWVAR